MTEASVRALAFYLPQFHPTPENDAWWGTGFTEWTNVVRAKPLYHGHRQPRLPTDLGFYDLRVIDTQRAQARLAAEHGLHGFCYYHYWFHGKQVLNQPLENMLGDSDITLPFCLFWANERWTRTWSGKGDETLIEQAYSEEDANALAQHLCGIFRDPRYIKVNNRPVFIVYHPIQIPIWNIYVDVLRQRVREFGFDDIYLCMVLKHNRQKDHRDFDCDAMIEFPPSMAPDPQIAERRGRAMIEETLAAEFDGRISLQRRLMNGFMANSYEGQTVHRTVTIDFDTTARHGTRAALMPDASPEIYGRWLRRAVDDTKQRHTGDQRLMFIFAWNEWAEGAYLEPDEHYGNELLKKTKEVLIG